jgi:CDP-4-dehydro-6-deoxyglucose reductase/ferredoxin-NAD(P)+ reductase (naphthalene dioxygenase ferredoxin-specific)
MPRVRIVNQPITLLATDQTILDAALAADLPYPYGCRAGTCGTCKARLLQGQVDSEPHAAEALSDAEAAAGLILACRATPRSDVVIECLGEWLEALPPVRHLQARVVALETVARAVTRLRLEVYGQPLCFLPGQYAELSFGGRPARAYSMANPPDDPTLEFHIRHFDGVASGYVTRQLGIGALVDVHGPYGNAYLRETSRPLVAVAGSTGLAPIRSILLTALARGNHHPMHLFFGVRDEPDLYGWDELRSLATEHPHLRVTPMLSKPERPTRFRTGLVHEALAESFASLAGYNVHLAGPTAMVEAARAAALALGAERQAILADAFVPTSPATTAPRGWLRSLLRASGRGR